MNSQGIDCREALLGADSVPVPPVSGADRPHPRAPGSDTETMVRTACGKLVSSWSETWRQECEAFDVLRRLSEGRDLLPLIASYRGLAAMNQLRERMFEVEHFFVLDRLPDKATRRSYLERVEKARGPAARQAVEARVVALWESRQAK